MKKAIVLLICLALLLGLCACGAKPAETTPATTAPAVETQPAVQDEQPQEAEPEQDMVEVVRQYIDKPLEDLLDVIGQPQSSDYVDSCLGEGEDGLLIYDGFVVYTYREGDSEVVYDVE